MSQELEQVKVHALMQTGAKAWDEDILRDLFNEMDMKLILQVPLLIHGTGFMIIMEILLFETVTDK